MVVVLAMAMVMGSSVTALAKPLTGCSSEDPYKISTMETEDILQTDDDFHIYVINDTGRTVYMYSDTLMSPTNVLFTDIESEYAEFPVLCKTIAAGDPWNWGLSSGETSATVTIQMSDPDPDPTPEKKEKKSESKYVAPKEENPAFTHPDREELKSILPQKSVIALNGALYDDLKVFVANDTTKANQALLVNTFAQAAGKKARIFLTYSLYTSRMLGADNGKVRTLKWVNLEKNPQIVYACCYNQTDKAYFTPGILDKDGTATFNDFILRDMTNITIFVLE